MNKANSNIEIHAVDEEDERQTPAPFLQAKKSALELKLEKEREAMDKKYITQGLLASRIFNERDQQDAFDKV